MGERLSSPVKPGDLVGGKYRIEQVLGAGAMGVVVAAVHEDLGEKRAIKFLVTHAQESASQLERFNREARAAARLKSPHVAHVFDVGRHEGCPYLVMEYLDGRDLYTVFHQEGPLSVPTALGFLLQACEGLSEAHALGIVHRDLKPANLFVEEHKGARTVKVLDFGISKVQQNEQGAAELTETAMMIGSPSYMAPEQMRSSRSVDRRADVWSLGVTLYQMVTGTLPFVGEDRIDLCLKVVQDQPKRPSEVKAGLSSEIDAVILRCIEKLPEHRYQDVAELAVDLVALAPSPAHDVLLDRIVRNLGHASAPKPSKRASVPAPPRDAGTAAAWTGSSDPGVSTARKSPGRPLLWGLAALGVAGVAGAAWVATTRRGDKPENDLTAAATQRIVQPPTVSPAPPASSQETKVEKAPEPEPTPDPKPSAAEPPRAPKPGGKPAPAKATAVPTAQAATPPPAQPPPPPTAKPDRHTF